MGGFSSDSVAGPGTRLPAAGFPHGKRGKLDLTCSTDTGEHTVTASKAY